MMGEVNVGNRRRITAVVVALAVLGALVVAGHWLWTERTRTDLSRALQVVPEETQRLLFTDWTEVRRALDVAEDGSPASDVIEDMMARAYDTDFSAVSSIDSAAVALQQYFGFSPATIDWEAYAQESGGATMVVKMPDGFDFDVVTENLDELGFTRPASADGVWAGGIDLVAAIDPTITPLLQYVAVLADQGLIVTSDEEDYAKKAAKVALGESTSLGDVEVVQEVVKPVVDPVAAEVWARDFACEDLSMSKTGDRDVQDQAEALVAAAGGITPLAGMVMSLDAERNLAVSQLFEDVEAAKKNLTSRATLAVGEAVGRGGTFSDDLELTSSQTRGATVQLRFEPRAETGFLLSALDTGPVLFATC